MFLLMKMPQVACVHEYITIDIDGMCVTSKIITFTLLSSTERVMSRA